MNTESIVQKIADEYHLRRRGKLYAGPCPFCGGSSKSDKFNIRPDGGYICRGCGKTGDIITWLRTQENLSCPDAHDRAGRPCTMSATCPAAAKCRYGAEKGAGKGQMQPARPKNHRHAMPYTPPRQNTSEVPTIAPEYPSAKWLAWADPFAAKGAELLLQSEPEMRYLAGRGIDNQAVARFGLGLIGHQYHVSKAAIGLAIEADGKAKLWVPEGLLLPIHDQGGALHRLRVRRPLAARQKFLQDLKYVWLKGSGNLPMAIAPSGCACRGAVIVEAELDAMAIAVAHPDVWSIAVGTLHGGVGADMHAILATLPVLLIALDAEAKAKAAVTAWKNSYPRAKYWPTPKGKDAGDYFALGGDLHAWIDAGLPPAATAPSRTSTKYEAYPPIFPALNQDEAFSPARKQTGGEGKEENKSVEIQEEPKEKTETTEARPEYIEITLSNGKIIYLVDNNGDVWDRLTAEGKPVFSRRELEKLKTATSTLPPDERIKAAMAAIEAKEVFGGYLTRGVCHG